MPNIHDMITLRKIMHHQEIRIALIFDFDNAIMNQIKTIPGRSWATTLRCWHIPYTKQDFRNTPKINVPFMWLLL